MIPEPRRILRRQKIRKKSVRIIVRPAIAKKTIIIEPKKGLRPRRMREQMEAWMVEAYTKMGSPELIGKIPWKWNDRLTSAMGRARSQRFGARQYLPISMDFSTRLFSVANIQQQRQTVFHECAHIVNCHQGTYRKGQAHGYYWKRLMRRADVPAKRCHNVHLRK